MNLKKLIFAAFCAVLFLGLDAQAYEITFQVDDYDNDTLLVGYYYGDRQLLLDTVYATKKGKFILKGDEPLKDGMYMALTRPNNNFMQFLINGPNQKFEVKFSTKDLADVKFKNSAVNQEFMDYLAFLKKRREKADPLREKIKAAKDAEKEADPEDQKQLDVYDKEVKDEQDRIVSKNPNSLFSNLLKSNFEITIPEYEGTEEEIQLKKYYYYKEHYFDHIDFELPGLIRTPYIDQRVKYYMDKLTPQAPDSINIAIDYILQKMEKNEEAYKFYLSNFLNTYAKNKFIGMDGVYVYLVDKYYSKGKADWVDEENLTKIKKNADELRPILIGKKFPNITTYKEDGTPVNLYDLDSPYTIVLFWAPDCGHCKKAMPFIIDFYKKYKEKGIKIISVCTKAGDKYGSCWEGVKEKGMEDFLNTGDEYQRYRKFVQIPTTPKMFILDDKKEILLKDFPAEEMERIMDEVIKSKEKETEKQ